MYIDHQEVFKIARTCREIARKNNLRVRVGINSIDFETFYMSIPAFIKKYG